MLGEQKVTRYINVVECINTMQQPIAVAPIPDIVPITPFVPNELKFRKKLVNDKEEMECPICDETKSCYPFFRCTHKCCFDCFIQMNKYQCYYNCDQDDNKSEYESDWDTESIQEDDDDDNDDEQDGSDQEDDYTELDKTERSNQIREAVRQYFIDNPVNLFKDESD